MGMGFDSKCKFAPPTILLRLLLCPWMWGISSWLVYWSAAAAPDLSSPSQASTICELCLEKAEELEIKLPTSTGSSKKKESSRKTSYSAFLTIKDFDCVDHNQLWKILKEMGISDHLTCLLRNLYTGQEATVRTGHGTTDCFQIGKAVR